MPLPAPLKGAMWMSLSGLLFACLSAIVRHTSADMHPFEISFFRTVIILVLMLAWKGHTVRRLKIGQWKMHILRAVSGTTAMLCIFSAFALLPVAEVTALTFTAPLFATVGAGLFLGETLRMRRWMATLIGFAGAMVILRPGAEVLTTGAWLAVAASIGLAVTVLSIKALTRTEASNTIILVNAFLMTLLSLIPALFVWTWPSPTLMGWMVLAGLVAFGIQQSLTRAFAAAEASAVLPFDFARLLFTALIGFLVFGEAPDIWTWVGGTIILAATVYIAHREAVSANKPTVRDPLL